MLLTIESLGFTYPSSTRPALDDISLSVDRTEYVAVLGANGSGKSTLARCVAGLLQPDAGTVRIDRFDDGSGPASTFPPHQVPSALVFQSPNDQIVAETVELDIAFGPENLGLSRSEMTARVETALAAFDLLPLSACSPHELSSGQKQHLALAGVTALAPALLLLDEPTSMLSPLSRASVLDFLDRFHAGGGTILHITHDLSEAARAQRVIVLDAGRLVFDGSPASLQASSESTLETWGLYGPSPVIPPRPVTDGAFALECRGLCFGPLRNVNVRLPSGSVTAVIGESGSGKTLLLELLTGLRVPETGEIKREKDQQVSLAVQESEASLFAEFVADDVAYGPRNAGLSGPELVRRVADAMDLVGLPYADFADRRTFSLSGGERRKAALAGIIAMNAPIILLDEPSSALDTRSRGQLLRLILALRESGKTVVFTTNRAEECRIADTVIELPGTGTDSPSLTGGVRSTVNDPELRNLEKLRRGASGSYRNIDSPIHRLAPISKYVMTACCIAAALAISAWPALVLLIILEFLPVLISRYPLKKLSLGILKVLPWLVFLAILQYLLTHQLSLAAGFILRFIALFIPMTVFVSVTGHTEIMYGMEDFLRPIRIFRIPVRDVSLVTGIVFRFITLLYEEAARITTARIIRRSVSTGKKSLFKSISALLSLFVPLVLRTLTRAERLAEAITARYYGTGKNSRYLHWQIEFPQRILIIAVPILSGAIIILSFYV